MFPGNICSLLLTLNQTCLPVFLQQQWREAQVHSCGSFWEEAVVQSQNLHALCNNLSEVSGCSIGTLGR